MAIIDADSNSYVYNNITFKFSLEFRNKCLILSYYYAFN